MKLTLCIMILLILPAVNAVAINVGVNEVMNAEIVYFEANVSHNLNRFSAEILNSGSTSYRARMRADIYNSQGNIFTGWSEEKLFYPGTREDFTVYWFNKEEGNFTVDARLYFADETINVGNASFYDAPKNSTEGSFDIINVKTYDTFVLLGITSNETANNVIVMPVKYPAGWIFGQSVEKNVHSGSFQARLEYMPAYWSPAKITLAIIGNNGEQYTYKEIYLDKQKTRHIKLLQIIYAIIDFINSK